MRLHKKILEGHDLGFNNSRQVKYVSVYEMVQNCYNFRLKMFIYCFEVYASKDDKRKKKTALGNYLWICKGNVWFVFIICKNISPTVKISNAIYWKDTLFLEFSVAILNIWKSQERY